jgi:hypothetical protein
VRIAGGVAVVLLVGLLVAQLVLPGIAARRARERVGRYGTVLSAHVSAFPAVELLWGHGSSASIRAGSLALSAAQGVDLLWEGRHITDADLSASALQIDGVTLRDARVSKRGAAVLVQGAVREDELGGALPGGLEVHSVRDAGGQLVLQATGSLLGVSATVPVVVRTSEGRLVAEPQGLPLGGLATLTVFADPRLRVEGIDVTPLPGPVGGPLSLRLTLRASLAGG